MVFIVVLTGFGAGVALSALAVSHPKRATLERISGVLLIASLALLGAALPISRH